MDLKPKILNLYQEQKKLINEYENLLQEYEYDTLVNENSALQKKVEDSKEELVKLRKDLEKFTRENESLKLALNEQIINEKLGIIKVSSSKLNDYFGMSENQHLDKLTDLEKRTKEQLDKLKETSMRNLTQKRDEFQTKINQLQLELNQALKEESTNYQESSLQLSDKVLAETDQLIQTEISPEIIEKRIKGNQLELKIGLSLINKIGMLLILFGVGAAFKYSFDNWMSDYLKGICFFLLGGLFLVGGEWLYRRQKEVFALGLLGGGIAVLYGSIFYSYFLLSIISLGVALVLSVLVTITSIILALRYQSQTISAFGLIGGFLPFISYAKAFGISGNAYLAVMGYLLILNMVILIISFKKRWSIIQYISFLMNTPSMIYLVFNIPWRGWGIGYAGVTFLMYLVICLSYPLKYRVGLKFYDLCLLGLNTAINCLVLFLLFIKLGLADYRGLLALIFCMVYFGLGQFITKKMSSEKMAALLFYATSLSFAVMIIPFQFGLRWLALGWLAEAILLIMIGSIHRQKTLEYSGWGIFGLCFGCFEIIDFLPYLSYSNGVQYFDFKYAAITIGQIMVLIHYLRLIRKNEILPSSNQASLIKIYQYFTIVCFWIYLLISANKLYHHWIPPYWHEEMFPILLSALVTFGIGYSIVKIPVIYDRTVKGISFILHLIADFLCVGVILGYPALGTNLFHSSGQEYLSLAIVIFFNILALLSIKDLILTIVKKSSYHLEMYPLLMGLILLGNITALLIVQFRLGDINLLFSFVCLILAISFITYGFLKKYMYIRRLGLGLTFFAIAKLFLYDLSFLKDLGRIIAYFGFGLVLLAISFIYQKIKSNMEGNNVTKDL